MKIDIENHNLLNLVLKVRYVGVMNAGEGLVWDRITAHRGQRQRLRC